MVWKFLLILILLAAAAVAVVILGRRRQAAERRRRQRRFELPESSQRVPLVKPPADHEPSGRDDDRRAELAAYLARAGDRAPDESDATLRGLRLPPARFVTTPDGDMLLTDPPFTLRPSLFTDRAARYATAISRRLPPWVIICPRVRLDTLLSPTAPDGRDADDWRTWRRRVRVRSVDLLLVDRRSWSPIIGIIFQRQPDARQPGKGRGGRDMMVEEVLRHVGLPHVVATGRMAEDWPAIRPWIEQALIEGPADVKQNGVATGGPGWDASAAAALLALDEDDDDALQNESGG